MKQFINFLTRSMPTGGSVGIDINAFNLWLCHKLYGSIYDM